jgi:hypothetical protein
MKISRRIKILVWVALFVILMISGFAFWMSDPLFLMAPSDDRLREKFVSHKAVFEKIHEMAIADSVYYLEIGHKNKGMDGVRQLEYFRLLKEIGGPTIRSDGSVSKYIYASGGLSAIGPGWQKGIKYRLEGCGVEIENLGAPKELEGDMSYCRKIDREWYILFEKFN